MDSEPSKVLLSHESSRSESPSSNSGATDRSPDASATSPLLPGAKEKTCKVCGDKALGYNFNVVTCESCKAFFRRNALKKKDFRCPFTNSCEINSVSRRFCQRCRLMKCFTVGMKKEWILTEQARIEKRSKVETKRQKRSLSGDFESPSKRSNSEFQQNNSGQNNNIQQFSPSDNSPSTTNGSAAELHVINLMSSNNGIFHHHTGSGGSSSCLPSPNSVTASFHHIQTTPIIQQFSPQGCPNLVGLTNGNPLSPFQAAAAAFQPRVHHASSGFRGGIQLPTTQHQLKPTPQAELHHVPTASVIQLIPPPVLDHKHAVEAPQTDRSRQQPESPVTVPKELLINLMRQCSGMLEIQQGALSTSYANRTCSCVCTCGARPGYPLYPLKVDKSTISDDLMILSPSLTPFDAAALDDSLLRILDGAIIAEFKDSPEPFHSAMDNVVVVPGLSQFEQAKLDELVAANECMQEPMEKLIGSNQKKDNPRLIDVINLTDIAIKRIIRMSKLIQGFKNLCQEDQIALLKGGCTEVMILRGVMAYDPDKDSWLGPKSHYIKLEILKEVKGGKVYAEHKRYLQSFHASWRTNEPVMLILGAIALFNPDRQHVLHRDIIRKEQEMYYQLLHNYLLGMYGQKAEADNAYASLCQKIIELHELNNNAVRIFLDVNPKEVEPLLIEIFDLK